MDRIILIAQQIAKEGKIPNTAMIKARLPKNVPLPAIIAGLKSWQENPNKKIISEQAPTFDQHSATDMNSFDALVDLKLDAKLNAKLDTKIIKMITPLIKPLEDEIEQLKAELKALKENR
jgi:hypothetical protein